MKAGPELAMFRSVVATRLRVEWLLRQHPLDVCVRSLDDPLRPAPSVDGSTIDRIGRWTARLLRNRRRPRTTCLHRALTRFALLRRLGVTAEFRLGLDPDGDLEGHAWIVLDGRPWMEDSDRELTATFVYPDRACAA